MPLLRFSRTRRRTFPTIPAMTMHSLNVPSMIASMPPIDTRQIERAVERGRAHMGSIAESLSNETMGELLDDLRHEAAARAVPMLERAAERATGRRRKSRKPKVALALIALTALAGLVAYLLWPRRDEEPAYLTQSPDQPDLTPAQTPPSVPPVPSSPSDGPGALEPGDGPSAEQPASSPTEPAPPAREYANAPHAIYGLGDRDAFEERPVEGNRSLPSAPRATFTPTPVQLPASPRRSWLPR